MKAKKEVQVYVGETHCLSMMNGELYISGEFGTIVWNCETLFTDLPHILDYVLKARTETDKRIKDDILTTIQESL